MPVSQAQSKKNLQNLQNKGVPQTMIANYGKRLNTKEMNKILGMAKSGGSSTQAPSPPPDPYAQLKTLQSAYQNTLSPSADETSAESSLKNIAYGKELGTQDAATQAIPIQFITGQQKAIENAAAIKSMPLEAQLKLLQDKRKSQADIAKSAVDFEQTRVQDVEKTREFDVGQAETKREALASEKEAKKKRKSDEKIAKITAKANAAYKNASLGQTIKSEDRNYDLAVKTHADTVANQNLIDLRKKQAARARAKAQRQALYAKTHGGSAQAILNALK